MLLHLVKQMLKGCLSKSMAETTHGLWNLRSYGKEIEFSELTFWSCSSFIAFVVCPWGFPCCCSSDLYHFFITPAPYNFPFPISNKKSNKINFSPLILLKKIRKKMWNGLHYWYQ